MWPRSWWTCPGSRLTRPSAACWSRSRPPDRLYCYDLHTLRHEHRDHLGLALSWGLLRACHRRIGCEQEFIYAALHQGGQNFAAWVGPNREDWSADAFGKAIAAPLAALDTEAMENFMGRDVGGPGFSLGDLFLEGRRSLAQEMAMQMTQRHAETARHIFEESRDLMLMLQRINVPMPPIFKALAQAMITDDLVRGMKRINGENLASYLGGLARQARRLGLSLEGNRLERALAWHLAECMTRLEDAPGETKTNKPGPGPVGSEPGPGTAARPVGGPEYLFPFEPPHGARTCRKK